MTREKAIKILECMAVDLTGALADTKEPLADVLRQRLYAIDVAQAALTPPTQEQMERVWCAEWLNFYGDYSTAECSKCGELVEVSPDEQPQKEFFDAFNKFYKFCPSCGRAMTPEAWKKQMERSEALWSIS